MLCYVTYFKITVEMGYNQMDGVKVSFYCSSISNLFYLTRIYDAQQVQHTQYNI
jgi:hypothetical protein